MEIQLIIFLLMGVALTAWFLKLRGVRTAYIWLAVLSICLLIWLIILFVPQEKTPIVDLNNWYQIGASSISLRFQITPSTFSIILLSLAYNLSFFFTAVARLNIRSDLKFWSVQLLQTVFFILAIAADNTWSLLLAWTMLDILGFLYQLRTSLEKNKDEIFRKVIIKFIGSMLLVWNIANTARLNLDVSMDNLAGVSRQGFFMAAFLHSGILPYTTRNQKVSLTKRVIDNSFSVLNFVASFMLVMRISTPELTPFLIMFLKLFFYFFIIFFAYQWMRNSSSDASLRSLLLMTGGIIAIFYLSNLIRPMYFLMVVMLFTVLFINLITHFSKNLVLFIAIMVFLISGLPLTIFSFGARGIFSAGINLDSIVLAIAYVFFISGILRLNFKKMENFDELEPWYQVSFLTGLFISFLTAALIVFRNLTSISEELNYWWMSLVMLGISLFLSFVFNRKSKSINSNNGVLAIQNNSIFSLNWLFKPLVELIRRIQTLINAFSEIIEGEGGVLWALVLLFLLLSMINPG